ncbi:MAG: sodium:solute symporter [Myxococcales bacterium]|nr:sodium:solute symporter [Myxococcales bacterium]
MTPLDWLVLLLTTGAIIVIGMWKTRPQTGESYLRGDSGLKWPTIGLSIMATQASAVTFLSTPGQAYTDGLRFIQFYFGLPLAMIVISVAFVPVYYRLKVYTAYEYLESRFDLKTRLLGASLFLVQRGLAAGITIYAPALILAAVLEWDVVLTSLVIGVVTVGYTVAGGSEAVSATQKQQMAVMLGGLVLAAVMVVWKLPDAVGLGDATAVAGVLGRINAVDLELDLTNRYNVWSGLLGGFFLALSYFGTDQSQVQRYLGGKSTAESRLGLLFNGLLKIPMQFLILFVGVMVLVYHQFEPSPVYFDERTLAKVNESEAGRAALVALEARHEVATQESRTSALAYVAARQAGDDTGAAAERLKAAAATVDTIRKEARELVKATVPGASGKDTDYIFISFVLGHMPEGVVGLLLAVILAAAMSSASSELNALGTTTVIDIHRRAFGGARDDRALLTASKGYTVLWGVIAMGFAAFASHLENLIQAVNVIGSLFYGTVLGLFVVALFLKRISATPAFTAAVLSETIVIGLWLTTDVGFLWFNVIGCVLVVVISALLETSPLGKARAQIPS